MVVSKCLGCDSHDGLLKFLFNFGLLKFGLRDAMYVLGLSVKDISSTECFVTYRALVFCSGESVDVLHMSG